jgi:DNA-binding NtrC family response regulator
MTRPVAKILVVDDEPDMAESTELTLERAGHEVVVANEGAKALELVTSEQPELVVTDLRMPGLDGLELIQELRSRNLEMPVIVLTGYASVDSAVEAMRKGAVDYLAKPFVPEELLLRVERALAWRHLTDENRYLREQAAAAAERSEMIGTSPALREVLRVVAKVAPTDTRVLVTGESGTGKELVARTIHRQSPRAGAPFFAVNCGALSEGLLESEIFGHEKGAFTGAVGMKKGFFEVAEQGTLFLDEISETSPAFQTRLLRVLQEGEFVRVGGTRPLKTNIRLISSTNRDPRKCVTDKRLREDLFYRLSVVQVTLPPLRERVADIPPLTEHFIQLYSTHIKKRVRGITQEAMDVLRGYRWPGNIRELENVIERAIIMCDEDSEIGLDDLPADIAAGRRETPRAMDEVQELEKEILIRALRECDWNRSQAARKLGIGRRTLYDRMNRYGISLKPSL